MPFEVIMDKQYTGFNPVQFGQEHCAPSHAFGSAVRPYWLLHYVVSGKGLFVREGERYDVSAGDMFVIPPHIETYYQADTVEPWHYIWIGFTADGIPDNVFSQTVLRCSGMGRIFTEMTRCSEMNNGKSAFLSGKIWELVGLLLEGGSVEPSHAEKACNIMNADYAGDITVESIAKRLNLDRTYFSAMFKKNMGVSPSDYLIDLRLRKAAEFMREYGRTPTVAAKSVGYLDYSHFSRAFKKCFGCSPRAYKKQYTK